MMEVFADGNGGFMVGFTAATDASGLDPTGDGSGERIAGVFWELAIVMTGFLFQKLAAKSKKMSWKPQDLIVNPVQRIFRKASQLALMVPCLPGTKQEFDCDQHLENPASPNSPLMVLQAEYYEEREWRVMKYLENQLKEAENDQEEDIKEVDKIQGQLCRASRFHNRLIRIRDRDGDSYRMLTDEVEALNEKYNDDVLAQHDAKIEELQEANGGLAAGHKRLQEERETIRTKVTALNKTCMDKLLKRRQLVQAESSKHHDYTEKIKVRNYLSGKLVVENREMNKAIRDLQQKIYALKCERVIEEEYYELEGKKYLPMAMACGLGVVNVIAIGILAYFAC